MKIEVGKFYKTRNGKKVRIYSLDGEEEYPVHGAIFLGTQWKIRSWRLDGAFDVARLGVEYDLVSEWEEPKPKWVTWLDKQDLEQVVTLTILKSGEDPNWHLALRTPWLDPPEDWQP